MKEKILAFIYNSETCKFLILNMTKHPDHAPEGGWFTVTGGVETGESLEEAVKREVKEETYDIVAYGESDPEKNKILYDTPLARGFIGKREGETFVLNLARQNRKVKILKLEPIPKA